MKDHDVNINDPSPSNPYRALLHKLTGAAIDRPRQQTAAKIWRKTQRDTIETETNRRAAEDGVSKKCLAPVRERVVKELFSKLSAEEKERWKKQAKEDHAAALDQWKKETSQPIPDDPESRQKYVSEITHVAFD